MTENAIRVVQLTKFYGKDRGIENVSFEIEKGEVFGFIGPNGAGKSTTIRTMLGLLQPTEGESTILGRSSFENGPELREKIGYLPSEVNYYDEMNSRELLEYSARFYKNANTSLINELAEYFELDLKKKISDLSFGNKKKCAIIQCVLHQPEILILDEPTSGLDPLMQNRFFELMEKQNAQGVTIFFSSHILSEVQRMCRRAAVIREGKIVTVETIKTLLEKQMKKVRLTYRDDGPSTFPTGARNIKKSDNSVRFEWVDSVNALTQWLATQNLQNVILEEPDLESIFMNYYQRN